MKNFADWVTRDNGHDSEIKACHTAVFHPMGTLLNACTIANEQLD